MLVVSTLVLQGTLVPSTSVPPTTRLMAGSIDPQALVLGDVISSGKYGTCQWAHLNGRQCVVKHAACEFSELSHLERDRKLAAEYLETEEVINGLLMERAQTNSLVDTHERAVAPYLGACVKDDIRYLVWQASGEENLESFLRGNGQRLPELARALGCEKDQLPRRVLHDIMHCLADVHACGVAHRDLKPSNVVVDTRGQTLRLVDFGSAADCAGWLSFQRRGWQLGRANQTLPCNKLFVATSDLEKLMTGRVKKLMSGRAKELDWYKFDIYSAALIWLCVAVPALVADRVRSRRLGTLDPDPLHLGNSVPSQHLMPTTLLRVSANSRTCSLSCAWVCKATSTTLTSGVRLARARAQTRAPDVKCPMPAAFTKHSVGGRQRAVSARRSQGC